ncbi:MAG: glycosyltransferase [Bacteroidia bacterium]|nr:glycosyltransferase [Bacteroidia bacterium]MCZ2277922.1 glycosyltransferase [Bacteroidia bacterium]
MKLLFVTPYYVPAWRYGGPPKCIADLAEYLAEHHSCQVDVLTLNANGPESLFATNQIVTQQVNGVTAHYLPRSKNFTGYAYFNSPLIKKALRGYTDVDLIHVNTLFNAFSKIGMQFAVKNEIPFILTPHGMLSDYSLRKSFWIKKIHRFFYEDNLLANAFAVHFTAAGESTRAVINKRIRKEIIPIGFNFNSQEGFIEKKDQPVLRMMFLGRLHAIKGLEPFLRAMSLLEQRVKDRIRYNLYGGDEEGYQQHLKQVVEQLNLQEIVKFCGPLSAEKRTETFHNHDVLVLTSYHENFGMAAAEALASGLPVLLSDQVSLAPFVIENRCGWVTPINENVIKTKIDSVFNTTLAERNAMGKRGFEAVRSDFSMEQVAGHFIKLYTEAIELVK